MCPTRGKGRGRRQARGSGRGKSWFAASKRMGYHGSEGRRAQVVWYGCVTAKGAGWSVLFSFFLGREIHLTVPGRRTRTKTLPPQPALHTPRHRSRQGTNVPQNRVLTKGHKGPATRALLGSPLVRTHRTPKGAGRTRQQQAQKTKSQQRAHSVRIYLTRLDLWAEASVTWSRRASALLHKGLRRPTVLARKLYR